MSKIYSEMKDTKIEWLKDIPLHWKVQKLKYLSQFHKSFFSRA